MATAIQTMERRINGKMMYSALVDRLVTNLRFGWRYATSKTISRSSTNTPLHGIHLASDWLLRWLQEVISPRARSISRTPAGLASLEGEPWLDLHMFRTLRARAGILSLSRLPLQVHSATRQNGLPIRRVRFLRPRPSSKSVAGSLVMLTALYGIFVAVVLSPLDKLEEDREMEQGGSIFIPFPGTIKQVQPPPYRGSDPEWQEYVKFSKDLALGKRVRDELAVFIQQAVEKHPILTLKCGKDIRLRRYWLDVAFPPMPPPEFERSGLEFTDHHVIWTTMPVDSLIVFRIRQALWPSALTQSLFSFSKVLFWYDTSTIGDMFGTQTKPQPSVDGIISQAMKRPSAQSSTSNQPAEETASPPTSATSRNLEEPPLPNPSHAVDELTPKRLDEVDKEFEAAQQNFNKNQKQEKDDSIKLHLRNAYLAFRMKFAQTWRPAPNYPPRGSIIVSGLIELDSPKAWLLMDVKAAWDPKTKQYDPRSTRVVMRRLQMKRQAPLGR